MTVMKRCLTSSVFTGLFMVVLIWYGLHAVIETRTIPAPFETLVYFVRHIDQLSLHMASSMLRVSIAVCLAVLIGVPSGIVIGRSLLLDKLFSPVLYVLYPIPKVAFLPVFMLLFGLGNFSKVILMIFIIVFQLMLSVRDGVKDISSHHFTVMTSMSNHPSDLYRYVILPAILPRVFSSLRISIGISLATLFFAENYATTYGIGYFILSAWTKINYVEMFSGIVGLSIIGGWFFFMIDWLEKKSTPWLYD